jgi:glycogen synthase
VVLEALAAGLPVLGSRTGGVSELLAPLGREWLVAPGEVASWVAALRALAQPERVEVASARARELYERSYSTATAVHALEEVYERARSRRAGSAP